jgi:hypothetical protein
VTLKICAECNRHLDRAAFHKNKRRIDGHHEYCKDCRKAQYLRRDQNGAIKRAAVRYAENRKQCLAQMSVRYKQIIEQKQAYGRTHYAANKSKYVSRAMLRKERVAQATPPWFDDFQLFAMQEAFDLADRRKKATGIEWNVDHIIPLRGKTVSGLNVIENIAVIPKSKNSAKRAQYLELDDRTLFYSRKTK